MARSQLLPDRPPPTLTVDEAIELVRAFLADELRRGHQGERLVAFNINEFRQITSVKGATMPAKFRRLGKPP